MLTVVGPGYERTVSIADAFADVGISTIDAARELITEITVPLNGRGTGSNYQRLAIRRSLALPMVAAAAAVTLVRGSFKSASLAVGPMAPVPLLVTSIDEVLQDKSASRENILKAAEKVAHVAKPRDSRLRGSREYRLSMAKILVFKAIMTASVRAHGSEE
jgi:CO/xanthine dehydrogenase FAD-binding subunit